MQKLTPEELAELESLETEEKERLDEEATAAKRQHLEALRMSKRLASKHGKPGHDFVVLETKVGNIAIRRPVDVEIDNLNDDSERDDLEKLATSIVIEPTVPELQKHMADQAGLATAIFRHSIKLLKVLREEEAKK